MIMANTAPAPSEVPVETRSAKLKAIFQRRDATLIPGTANALFARVIESLGYECCYITGAGVSNMTYGLPDVGLVTMSEMAEHIRSISAATSLPLLVDGDTGFGNSINTYRTVSIYEAAGASGIQLEDQVFPKKCGHFEGKAIIPLDEMISKIHAAADARLDDSFQIIARTDAIAIEGLSAALNRANAFVEAGADVVFVEAPVSRDDLARIAREVNVPQIVNIVHGGKTPPLPREALRAMGFAGVLYANAALQSALFAVTETLTVLRDTGSLEAVSDRLASFEMRQESVQKARFDELEKRYS